MNIIYLCPEMLIPANTGGRIGTLKRVEYLSKRNDVYLFCVTDSDADEQYKPELEKFCKEVHLYNRRNHKLKACINALLYPYACASRTLKSLKHDVDTLWSEKPIDYVIVDYPQMMKNISSEILNSGRVILGEHNIEFLALSNLSESITNPLKHIVYKIESRRLYYFEKRLYSTDKIKLYTFVSSEDKAYFERIFGKNNTLHIPVGSEIKPYKNAAKEHNIMFFGKMEYPANAEAACDFAKNVFPRIQSLMPDATLYLVGKNPLPKVVQLKDQFGDSIVVTGTVDSVEPYYEKAGIVVVPLKHGGGVKVKVLEALGHGRLILTTQKGIEGTDFKGGKHLVVTKNDEDFASKCVEALQNPENFEEIRRAGYEYVKNHYTWQAIIDSFEEKLKTGVLY